MCGIFGFNFEDKSLLKKGLSKIVHRGPDDHGIYLDKGISLGHQRLSIIDLTKKGHQPMCDKNNEVVIVYNGEVYNYKKIRKKLKKKYDFISNTDTEVILYAYKEYGTECLRHFNGMFAFCIYDKKKNILFLARDRIGIKPLYYYYNKSNNKFIFASEIKSILEDKTIKREIDLNAFNNIMSLKYNLAEQTILKKIYKLLPSTYLIFDLKKSGQLKKKKYWSFDISDKNILDKGESYFKEKFLNLFYNSVKKRLISDVPLGVYLSGGIDSSSILAMMNKIKKELHDTEPIRTFSIGFGYNEDIDELRFSKKISSYFNTDHSEFNVTSDSVKLLPEIVWLMDEPMGELALIPIHVLSKKTREKKNIVVLTGDGADEIFAGYEQTKFLTKINYISSLPLFIRKNIFSQLIKFTPKSLFNIFFKYYSSLGEEGVKRTTNLLTLINNKPKTYLEFVSFFNQQDLHDLYDKNKDIDILNLEKKLKPYFENKNHFLNQILKLELENTLPENYLMKVDRMTMAHGVEARVPFLDHSLVEFSTTIPVKLKLNGFNEKYILKKSMSNLVPKFIIKRTKQRFYVPVDLWIQDNLKPMLQEFLNKKHIKKQGFFNSYAIEKIFNNYNNSRLIYGRQLWNLLNFQLWYKIYIENQDYKKIKLENY